MPRYTQSNSFVITVSCGLLGLLLAAPNAWGQVNDQVKERAQLASGSGDGPVALIDDTSFERGFIVWSPRPGRKVAVGQLQPFDGHETPVWELAQWSSRFNLAQAKREVVSPGVIRFFDGAKSVVYDFRSAQEPVVALALNGIKERSGKAPKRGATWPHLLIERKLLSHPRLPQLDAVDICISYRLIQQEVEKPAGWDPRRHTAQFLLYLTLQNQNKKSAGFGDYLWFGVSMYDARYRHTPPHKMADLGTKNKKGTGKFIFNPAGKRYTPNSAHDGQWITIQRNLLPLMKEALQDAWSKGFLSDSHELQDYGLGGINCGWEVTGTWNVAMQIKNLRLEATLRD